MFAETTAGFLTTAALAAVVFGASPGTVQAQQIDGSAIDAVFADIEGVMPGCAVGVVQNQELAYANGFGMANLDYNLPITPTSNFYLGSVGKQFTAAAIAHAVRAGHLSLDDPIQKWLPQIPEYERTITIRNLIHHTSGIRDYLGLWNLSGKRLEDVHSIEETLELIARQRNANFAAGDEYLYSNSGYFLLSEIIERATDMSLREYMQQHFLGPLGMGRSRFNDDRLEVMDQRVVGYQATEDGYQVSHPWNFDKVGSGGMYSSIEDLADWDRNYYTEEVGGPGFTDQLVQRGVLTNGTVLPYAFGLTHGEYRGLKTIGHGGSLAGFRSMLLRFPDQETTVLVLCSYPTANPGMRAQRVADVVLTSQLAPVEAAEGATVDATPTPTVELTTEQLEAFVGHWRASMGIEVEIVREGDQLIFIQSGNRVPLVTAASDRLLIPVANIDIRTTDLLDGRFQAMSVTQNGQAFTADRFVPSAAPASYSDLYGSYYSGELDVTYSIFEEDGQPMMEITPSRRGELRRVAEDRFVGPGMTISIDRQADGVIGFTIDAGRVRGIYFQRMDQLN